MGIFAISLVDNQRLTQQKYFTAPRIREVGLAAKSDWVLPEIEEGRVLTGKNAPTEIADFYLERGATLVVIKLGPKGAFVKNRERETLALAVPVAKVIDTVGAGDGFAVGLISALLGGKPPDKAAARGNQIAALVIQHVGDSEGLPTREQLPEQ